MIVFLNVFNPSADIFFIKVYLIVEKLYNILGIIIDVAGSESSYFSGADQLKATLENMDHKHTF